MAKVLVTGGAGFIGSHLCEALLAEGHEVIALDNLALGKRENLSDKVRFIQADVHNLHAHLNEFEGVSTVFHLAALISGFDSLSQPDEYVRENITGLQRVIDLAKQLKRPRIIFASSSTVYGNSLEPTKVETTPPSPVTLYALTKLAGEHLLEMYRELNQYEYCALRLFNVYGPRQNQNHPYANVTCKFSHAAANGLPVKLYGTGKQTRDFVYVGDVVSAMMRAMNGTPSRLYNIGTAKDASIASLLELVQKVSGRTLTVEQFPPWSNDIQAIRADVTRMRSETGWEPKVALEEGLRRTVDFFRENR